MYRSIFVVQRRGTFNIILIAFEIILVMFYGAQTVAKFTRCVPLEKVWHPHVKGVCHVNWDKLLVSSGAFSWVSDILIVILPIRSVWKLQMNRPEKIRMLIVFMVGLM